jgi:hypothetical protein
MYFGVQCENEYPFCYGKYSSGKGECIGENKCCCDTPNAGYNCQRTNTKNPTTISQCVTAWTQ